MKSIEAAQEQRVSNHVISPGEQATEATNGLQEGSRTLGQERSAKDLEWLILGGSRRRLDMGMERSGEDGQREVSRLVWITCLHTVVSDLFKVLGYEFSKFWKNFKLI